MKPRSPGFTAGRLTQARESAGLTKAELAGLVGVTSAAIGQYEAGERTPGPDILERLSNQVGQPLAFFMRPAPPTRSGVVFYRSFQAAARVARLKAQARMTFLWDAMDYFSSLIELPAVDMPKVGSLPWHPREITDQMIESAALIARQHWNLGDAPAPNIVWLLEGSGAVVMRLDLGSDKLEALSEWRDEDGRPYVILNSLKRNAFRSRADVAHELGHLLLHRHVTQEQLDDKETFKLIEEQAWQFAQNFLLPDTAFMRDVYSLNLDALRTLKPKWKVSIAFMLHRIYSLGVLSSDKYTNYRKYLAQRGWLKTEPFDIETEPEQPLLLKQMVEFMSERKIHSPDQLLTGLAFNPELLEELTQVDQGFFQLGHPRYPMNVKFSPKRRVG
ncbi:XRE family transcriptional regulator (plasmid) [Deinococcus sp. KNUC1210]|uniref:helix-turn-helix domain-containing protein n=1 Tax=Deinococcus sp. KNUC1210 TaxID=2917691 RepID=UPI001EF0BB7E|nr:XRE family transcriptional regulator [Deinococcus sp. KNUC1210]ULH17407.1 XRE family transcriptional regulator [Deinococcus sp. KNUC1210]